MRYLENTNDIDELKYIFNAKKANSNQVKEAFRRLLVSKADELFDVSSETGLGTAKMKELFEFDNFQFQNSTDFKNLLNNNELFRNETLKFIIID